MHADPVARIALFLAVILVGAKVGGEIAVRIAQPAVLGELLFGVVLGNLHLLQLNAFEPIKTDPFLDILAGIGVLVLLFEVGLESTVAQMLKVGFSSVAVALLGVVAPFFLGWGVGAWLLPQSNTYVHVFLGARLSVGLGMIPRGEVGLIFANIGLGLTIGGERILDQATFSAVVVMVIVTTLVTPPALAWRLRRVS